MSLAPLGHKKIGPRAPTPEPRREYALWRTLVVTSKGTHTTLPIPVARCRGYGSEIAQELLGSLGTAARNGEMNDLLSAIISPAGRRAAPALGAAGRVAVQQRLDDRLRHG